MKPKLHEISVQDEKFTHPSTIKGIAVKNYSIMYMRQKESDRNLQASSQLGHDLFTRVSEDDDVQWSVRFPIFCCGRQSDFFQSMYQLQQS